MLSNARQALSGKKGSVNEAATTLVMHAWTRWGDRLLAFLALGLAVSLAYAWTLQYYNPDVKLISIISYKVDDPSWMPPPQISQPMLGLHQFGDLQLALGYARTPNPYDPALLLPAQTPPVGIWEWKLLDIFGESGALFMYVTLSVGLLAAALWLNLGKMAASRKLLAVVMFGFLSGPLLMALDRGACQAIMVGSVGLAIYFFRRRTPTCMVISGAFMVAAIGLKPYAVVVLLLPLLRGAWRYAAAVAGTVAGLCLIGFALTPGGFTQAVSGYIIGSGNFVGERGAGLVSNSPSFTGIISQAYEAFSGHGAEGALYNIAEKSDYLLVPSLVWAAILVVILLAQDLPEWLTIPLVLASNQVLLPGSAMYVMLWGSLAAVFYVSAGQPVFGNRVPSFRGYALRQVKQPPSQLILTIRIMVLFLLVVTIVPQFWHFPFSAHLANQQISTIMVGAVTVAALIWIGWTHRIRRAADAVTNVDRFDIAFGDDPAPESVRVRLG